MQRCHRPTVTPVASAGTGERRRDQRWPAGARWGRGGCTAGRRGGGEAGRRGSRRKKIMVQVAFVVESITAWERNLAERRRRENDGGGGDGIMLGVGVGVY